MKKEHELVISRYLNVNPVVINSSLVSAQNRVRLYWTNINLKPYGMFGDMAPDITQPKDKGILLKHILETEVDEKYYISEVALKRVLGNNPKINPEKSYACVQNNNTGFFGNKRSATLIQTGVVNDNNELREVKQSLSIDANYAKGMDNHAQRTMIMQVNGSNKHGCERVYNSEGETPSLLSSKFAGVPKIMIPEATKKGFIEIEPGQCFDAENPNSKTRRGRKMDSKSNNLMAQQNSFMNYTLDKRIRRLTPVECERLQTVPDNYSQSASDSQRYRMLGNGWTVDVIAHIFFYLTPNVNNS